MKHNTLTLAVTLAVATFGAQAQQLPNIGDALRQVQPAPMPAPTEPALPAIGNLPLQPPMQALPGDGASIELRELRIVGNREIDSAALQAQLAGEAGGKRYTLPELEALATRLTRYYRANGYFVARAYVPAQELQDGVLTLRVVEGNYGRFVLSNESRVRDDVVQGLLDDVKKYDIVSLDTLERAMLIINDTPGVKVVRADVMPGQQVGTSDFAIGTEATPGVNGFVLADNYGSRYTGKARLTGNVDWNSPSGRGDRLSATGLLTNGSDLYNGRLGYSTLVATNGTRIEGALSRTRYSLTDRYASLGATGTADSFEAALTTPWKRTRAASVELGFSVAARRLRDEVSSTATVTPKRSTSATASLTTRNEHALAGYDGLTQASAALTVGRLDFRDAAAESLDAQGARTQGNWAKLSISVSRTTLLPHGLTLSTSAKAQAALSDRNLDGSERMSVSGPGGVQAYPSGELSGDHAALLRIELSKALPLTQLLPGNVQWSASAFTDAGWARAVHEQAGGIGAARTLADVGLGLSASLPQGGIAKLQLAHRTSGGDPVSESVPRTRLLLQGGWVF